MADERDGERIPMRAPDGTTEVGVSGGGHYVVEEGRVLAKPEHVPFLIRAGFTEER